jgi:hypothetical protein
VSVSVYEKVRLGECRSCAEGCSVAEEYEIHEDDKIKEATY